MDFSKYGWEKFQSINMDVSHNFAHNFRDISTGWTCIQLAGPYLMVQIDVSKAGAYLNLEHSIDGATYIPMKADASITIDASLRTTNYVLELKELVPLQFVRPKVNEKGYGFITKIKMISA